MDVANAAGDLGKKHAWNSEQRGSTKRCSAVPSGSVKRMPLASRVSRQSLTTQKMEVSRPASQGSGCKCCLSISTNSKELTLSKNGSYSRFPSNPIIIIRVPFFFMFSFNKETPK